LVCELGRLRYTLAVPTLVRLWERCPVVPVWQAAGHALFQIGTPEAHGALQGALEEADHFATFLAIKSIVATDPASAGVNRRERHPSDRGGCRRTCTGVAARVLDHRGGGSGSTPKTRRSKIHRGTTI
jgi:hypothetical protein